MSLGNPIQYVSRTYNTIINDINTDTELADKPNWWKRVWAGIGDVLSMWLNSIANLLFLRTSYTRGAVKDLLELIDYDLSPHSTSSGTCLFYVDTSLDLGIYPFTVTAANLSGRSEGNLAIGSKKFEARASVNFTSVSEVFAPAAVNTGTDIITVATDYEYTGHKVRFVTVTTLPAPLAVDTDYYIIYVGVTSIKLAVSLADAFAGNVLDLTTQGVGNHTLQLYSKAVTMYQQESLTSSVVIGTSDGVTEWQEFNIPDKLMLEATLVITINAVPWSNVTTLVDSTSVSTDYKTIPKSENQFAVRFGDGTYGKIPEAFDIGANYSYGGGSDSNVSTLNRITIYAGSDTQLTGISNVTVLTGGGDEEDITSAKRLGPLLLKARDRFVTVDDGEALVLNYGGVSQVIINKNVYGILSCQVSGIADGGGDVSGANRTIIQQFLIDRTILESIDVRFGASTITAIAVTSAAKMASGFIYANVLPFFELAYLLLLSETGQEIKDEYDSDGIGDAVTLINSIFTKTFDEDDYQNIIPLLENLTPVEYGSTFNESDVFGYIDQNVIGIDYLTIAVFGGGLPLTLSDDEISTNGALTLSEIP